jgi:hypothetical protein
VGMTVLGDPVYTAKDTTSTINERLIVWGLAGLACSLLVFGIRYSIYKYPLLRHESGGSLQILEKGIRL